MHAIEDFFSIDTTHDLLIPPDHLMYFFDDNQPSHYKSQLIEVLLKFIKLCSLDWEYIYNVIGYVPGSLQLTLEEYAECIARHEILHFEALPIDDPDILGFAFGIEINKTKKGYRLTGLFKVSYSSMPRLKRAYISYKVAINPSVVEGTRLSVKDLKHSKKILGELPRKLRKMLVES